MLERQGEKEYDAAIEELNKRLERMTPWSQMKLQAEMMDSMAKILAGKPMKIYTV